MDWPSVNLYAVLLLEDLDFRTPVRVRHRKLSEFAESQPATPTPLCPTARNIYSPIVRFLTPTKESEYLISPPLGKPNLCCICFGIFKQDGGLCLRCRGLLIGDICVEV